MDLRFISHLLPMGSSLPGKRTAWHMIFRGIHSPEQAWHLHHPISVPIDEMKSRREVYPTAAELHRCEGDICGVLQVAAA